MSRLLIIIFLLSSVQAMGQDRGSTEQEFDIKKKYLKQRYEDFFIREIEADRRERKRLESSEEQKKARREIRETYEQARKEYIANRKAKPVRSDEEYQKELAEQRAAHEKARREYIRRQRDLNSIEASTGVIPDWIEYKLYESFETTDSLEE